MSLEELREELEQARDAYNEATLENERLIDEREGIIENIQLECDNKITALEEKHEEQLEALKRDCDFQVEGINRELDLFRRAATGDPCGWEELADGTFQNNETKETSAEEPPVLTLARGVQRADDSAAQAEALKRAEKRSKVAETKRRQLEVEVNEAKAGAASQRDLLARWGEAAADVHAALVGFNQSLEQTCDKLLGAGDGLTGKARLISSGTSSVQVVSFQAKLKHAVRAFQHTKGMLSDSRALGRRLEVEVFGLTRDLGEANVELGRLRTSLSEAVEAEVEPMRGEVAAARNDLVREKVLRFVERQQFASLWPREFLMPSALRRHLPIDPSHREQLKAAALAAEADANIKREIRRKVADAARWSQVIDDYGRQYYAHADTGEASWEPPEAMLYEPPPGRDGLGNIVVTDQLEMPPDEASTHVDEEEDVTQRKKKDKVESPKNNNWIEVTDDWGQKVWKNTLTGEMAKTRPGSSSGAIPEGRDERQHGKKPPESLRGDDDDDDDDALSSDDEREPTTNDGAAYFIERVRERQRKSKRRKRKAMLAARRALGFLEEEAYRVAKRRIANSEDLDDDAPAFVDIQAMRELAAGDEGWTYMVLDERKVLKAKAEAARLKAQKEAEAIEAARRAEIQRTLEERRKATGLSRNVKPPPEKKRNKQLESEEKGKVQLAEKGKSKLGSDVYYALVGSADGFDDTDKRSVSELRDELESKARLEEHFMGELAKTRRRLEAVSLRLLKCRSVGEVEPPPRGSVVPKGSLLLPGRPKSHEPTPPAPPHSEESSQPSKYLVDVGGSTPRASAGIFGPPVEFSGARNELHALGSRVAEPDEDVADHDQRCATRWQDSIQFAAGANGTLPPPACPAHMSAMRAVHLLAAEAVWAGLNGTELRESVLRAYLRDLEDSGDGETLDKLSIACFFTKGQSTNHLELVSSNAASVDSQSRIAIIAAAPTADDRSIVRSVARPSARRAESQTRAADEEAAVGSAAAYACSEVAAALMKHGAACSASLSRSRIHDVCDDSRAHKVLTAFRHFARVAERSPDFDEALDVVRTRNLVGGVLQEHLANTPPVPPQDLPPPPPPDDDILVTKIAAEVDDSASYASKVTELLELGVENELPEQIAALHRHGEGFCKAPAAAYLETLLFDAPAPVAAAAAAAAAVSPVAAREDRKLLDATRLLGEAALAHERTLEALFKHASQLGTRAWSEHQAELERLRKLHEQCNKAVAGHRHRLDEVTRQVKELVNRIDAARRVGGMQGQGGSNDSRDHRRLRQSQADAGLVKTQLLRMLEEAGAVSSEMDAERERGAWLAASANHVATMRALHINERERQARALTQLQESLLTVWRENSRAGCELESGDATVALEVQAASRIAIVRLRERMREEGRRRRWLREEELAFFRTDVRRLDEDRAAQDERAITLQVVAKARDECDDAVDSLHAERVAIVAARVLRVNVVECATVLDARVAAAYSRLALLELSRESARSRERRQRRESIAVTSAAAKIAAPLPVVDDGCPRPLSQAIPEAPTMSVDMATADALTAAALLRLHRSEGSDLPGSEACWATTACVLRVAHEDVTTAWRSASRFATTAEAEARGRARDQQALLQAIDALQKRLVDQRQTNKVRHKLAVDAGVRASASTKQVALDAKERMVAERAAAQRDSLRDMRLRDESEIKLRRELETAKRRSELCISLSEAMRYGLGLEKARRKVCDKKILSLTEALATLRGRCNDEIRAERAHSARIELWVHAMLSVFAFLRTEIAHREHLLDAQQELDKKAQRNLKHGLWRQTTAAQMLGLDVDALMLYFAQRMVALAGAHYTFNNALRANGAPLVLAAMCQSPRGEIRRLGAKALAALSWDGHVDSRTLGSGVRDQWRFWVEVAVGREEEHQRRELALFAETTTRKSEATARIDALALTDEEEEEPSSNASAGDDEAALPTVSCAAIRVSEGDERLATQMTLSRIPAYELSRTTPRDVAVARRQWALRRRRACEGPNRENMRILAAPLPTTTSAWLGVHPIPRERAVPRKYAHLVAGAEDEKPTGPPPLVATLLTLVYERDQDCVLAAATGLAAASYDSENAFTLGRSDGIVEAVVYLAKHENPEVVALACDAAANLGFQQQWNQEALGNAGLIEILVELLRPSADGAVVVYPIREPTTARVNDDGSESPFDTDVAEAAACALANALSLHASNAARLAAAGGLDVLLELVNSSLTVNLLDVDQAVEIQTNAANALANAAAGLGEEARKTIVDAVDDAGGNNNNNNNNSVDARDGSPLAAFVMLTTSPLIAAKIAAALLLGNLAQDILLQADLGRLGAIEALWGMSRDAIDAAEKTTALWALSNLAWANRANQDRCTDILEGLLATAAATDHPSSQRDDLAMIAVRERASGEEREASWFEARVSAVDVIANALHYHDDNRHLVEVIPGGVELLVGLCHAKQPAGMREAALRCVASIASTDRGARRTWKVSEACIVMVMAAGDARVGGKKTRIRQLGAAALANVAALPEARAAVRAAGGVEALVALAGSADPLERDEANAALAALEDNVGRQPRSIASNIRPSAGRLGAKALVSLLRSKADDDPRAPAPAPEAYFAIERSSQAAASAEWARRTAAETLNLGSEWLEHGNLEDLVAEGAIDALFATLVEYRDVSVHDKLLVATLGAVYACAQASEGRHGLRERAAEVRGIQTLVAVGRAALVASDSVLEAALRALVPLAINNAPNSRTLMAVGLDFLLDIAESPVAADDNGAITTTTPEVVGLAVNARGRDIAATLLRVLAPYNLIVCHNCSTTNRSGLICVYCGHSLAAAAPGQQQQQQQSSTKRTRERSPQR